METSQLDKIIIVSLCDSFTKDVGERLSQKLGMMFCDSKDLVEYELIDKKSIEKFCTKEYLEQAERSVFQHVASFVNVVVSINFDYLFHHFDILKTGSFIVFLNLSKKFVKQNANSVDSIAYENRTTSLKGMANVSISIKKTETNFVCDKIIDEIGRML